MKPETMVPLRYRAVVFDLDDTLTSEAEYQVSAGRAVLRHLSEKTGLSLARVERESEHVSDVERSAYFQTLLPRLGIESDSHQTSRLVELHRGHSPEISWYPDVAPVLESLRGVGAKLGVVTDGYAEAQRRKLAVLRAEELFDAIVVSDEFGRDYWKPHPEPFLRVCAALGVQPDQMIYVGDNPAKDFYISRLLPVVTVRLVRNGTLKGHLDYREGVREQFLLDDIRELTDLFCRLNGAVD